MARALTAIVLAGASVLGLATAPSGAAAQGGVPGEVVTVVDPIDVPPENDPLKHAFDLPGQRGGFYLRPSLSLGVQNTRIGPASWEDELGGRSTSGFGTGYGLDIGGFVRPWLALHLDAHLGVLWNGDVDGLGIQGQPRSDVRILAYGVAPAVTFITQNGFYFKPAFGVGFATLKQSGDTRTSDPGFFMDLVAGKDLYVDRNFSVGLQFQVVYLRLGADTVAEELRVRQFLFGLSFGFDSR